ASPKHVIPEPATMLLFGVTGGIGCGKTAVCKILKEKGVPILEADPLAKELTNRLPEIRQALILEFGKDVYGQDGKLNKDFLSQIVFSNPEAREKVNQIIHPHVLNWINEEAKRLHTDENQKLVGVEAALIYESKMDRMLDAVVVVSAPLEKRIKWLQKRNNVSGEEILKRIDSQMPLAEKVKRADYVIENDGSLSDLEKKVDLLYKWLQKQQMKSSAEEK
ncbi:MAG: dephospho-CoA kinase, partial [bacterium]